MDNTEAIKQSDIKHVIYNPQNARTSQKYKYPYNHHEDKIKITYVTVKRESYVVETITKPKT